MGMCASLLSVVVEAECGIEQPCLWTWKCWVEWKRGDDDDDDDDDDGVIKDSNDKETL